MNQNNTLSEWLSYMGSLHVSAIDLGLSRVLPVFEKLAIAKNAYVFTVAGTNGKGSTTTAIAQFCQSAGLKTALYQSPHLISFNERVRLNGVPVTDAMLIDAFVQVEAARVTCQLSLSFFEMTTLAAFVIFAKANCDVWVLEVGLGGRLDVVNIIDPDMAVITNIGIDHVDWLGDNIEKIGYEKAGILRHNIPLVFGDAEMPASVLAKANAMNSPVYQVNRDYSYMAEQNKQTWLFSSPATTLKLNKPTLSLTNVSTALMAFLLSPFAVTQAQLNQALTTMQLTGRFDKRRVNGHQLVFDVAHNPHGVTFLLSQFMPYWQAHQQAYPQATLHVVFAMLADKDITQVVTLLTQLPIHTWHIAQINHTRAASLDQIMQILQQQGQPYQGYASLPQAWQGVWQQTDTNDMILVCGSFHTIAEILQGMSQS